MDCPLPRLSGSPVRHACMHDGTCQTRRSLGVMLIDWGNLGVATRKEQPTAEELRIQLLDTKLRTLNTSMHFEVCGRTAEEVDVLRRCLRTISCRAESNIDTCTFTVLSCSGYVGFPLMALVRTDRTICRIGAKEKRKRDRGRKAQRSCCLTQL